MNDNSDALKTGQRPESRVWLTWTLKELLPIATLILGDGILFVWMFGSLPLTSGAMAYGDLGAVYWRGMIRVQLIGSLWIYPLAVQNASLLFGPVVAQNGVYLASLFVPSIGVYFLATLYTRSKAVAVAISLVVGTPLNPLLLNNFINGAFEFCLWLTFALFCVRFIVVAYRGASPIRNATFAGLFFALSVTQVGSSAEFPYAAAVMTGAVALPQIVILLAKLDRPLHVRALSGLGFLATAILAALPAVLSAIATYTASSRASATSDRLIDYVIGNARFTFASYGAGSALFDSPFHFESFGWPIATDAAWTLLICVVLVGGIVVSVSSKYPARWEARASMVSYLAATIAIAGMASGLLIPIYRVSSPLDFLDNPQFFLYVQTLALPIPAAITADLLISHFEMIPASVRVVRDIPRTGETAHATQSRPTVSFLVRGPYLPHKIRVFSVASVILVAGLVASTSFVTSPSSAVYNTVYTQAGSPFATSANYSGLKEWYQSPGIANSTSRILIFPNTYLVQLQVGAFVPLARTWTVPFLGNYVNSSYTASLYLSTLSLLANGSVGPFAEALGFSGVEYVVVLPWFNVADLAPSYLLASGFGEPMSVLLSTLTGSSYFRLTESGPRLDVFVNNLYSPAQSPTNTVFHVGGPGQNESYEANLLDNPQLGNPAQFDEWIAYPTNNVTLSPGKGVILSVNGSQTINYALFTDGVNISGGSQLTPPPPTNSSITFNASYYSREYSITFNASIPTGMYLEAILFWYNTTSILPLYSQFAAETVANLTSTSGSFSYPVSIPTLAHAARLYFLAVAQSRSESGKATLFSASFDETFQPASVSVSPTASFAVSNLLNSRGAFSKPATVIPYPFECASDCKAVTTVTAVPAGGLDPAFASEFGWNNTAIGVGSGFSGPEAIFVAGESISSVTVKLSTSSGTNFVRDYAPVTTFVAVVNTSSNGINFAVSVNISGEAILFFVGAILPPLPSTSASQGLSIFVPLPIGTAHFVTSVQGFAVVRVYSASSSVPQTVDYLVDWTPFVVLSVVIGLSLLVHFDLPARALCRRLR